MRKRAAEYNSHLSSLHQSTDSSVTTAWEQEAGRGEEPVIIRRRSRGGVASEVSQSNSRTVGYDEDGRAGMPLQRAAPPATTRRGQAVPAAGLRRLPVATYRTFEADTSSSFLSMLPRYLTSATTIAAPPISSSSAFGRAPAAAAASAAASANRASKRAKQEAASEATVTGPSLGPPTPRQGQQPLQQQLQRRPREPSSGALMTPANRSATPGGGGKDGLQGGFTAATTAAGIPSIRGTCYQPPLRRRDQASGGILSLLDNNEFAPPAALDVTRQRQPTAVFGTSGMASASTGPSLGKDGEGEDKENRCVQEGPRLGGKKPARR